MPLWGPSHPSQSPVSRCALSAQPAAAVRCGGGGEGGGGFRDMPLVAPSARDGCSAAGAWSHCIRQPRHAGVRPPSTARVEPPHREGPGAITSPQGALLGCGRLDNLLPHGGSGPQAHPEGKHTGAEPAAITTSVSSGRGRQGVKGLV